MTQKVQFLYYVSFEIPLLYFWSTILWFKYSNFVLQQYQ